jgi:hypothetical protein
MIESKTGSKGGVERVVGMAATQNAARNAPSTRCMETMPPASSMRFRSSSRYGLWSLDSCLAAPPVSITLRESPAFPTTTCVGVMMAQMAVHPDVSCRVTNSSSVLSTASSSRYALLMASPRCFTSRDLWCGCFCGVVESRGIVWGGAAAAHRIALCRSIEGASWSERRWWWRW